MIKSIPNAYSYISEKGSVNSVAGNFKTLKFKARKEDWVALREVFLDDEYSLLDRIITPQTNINILDLGANIGTFALRAFAVSSNISVYSVEAAKDTFEILKENINQNKDLNWHPLYGAAWHSNGSIYLKRTKNSLGHRVGSDDTGEEVPAFTLEEIIKTTKQGNFDIIKIDIEGAEEHIVLQNIDLLAKTPALIIEIHNDRIDGDKIIALLKQNFKHNFQLQHRKSVKPVYIFCQDGKYYDALATTLLGG